ncbi:hypothetical protein [Opitutus terrae]|uniref:Uncharacterized protein n=1 Tax=Opitutus terrae (strain DSM 11246 / JCM 15787 / PB90-1) TaxID=452637 RepID=B1ZMP5_OPITP|nr:hypothetical protein [Opitutus terrae]ACB75323.1 conserved hypothetical protein [Opitutus terrae PB90-1]
MAPSFPWIPLAPTPRLGRPEQAGSIKIEAPAPREAAHMDLLEVNVDEHRANGMTRREVSIGGTVVWFEFSGDILPNPISLLDFAVAACVFPAMRRGTDVRIRGRVSRLTLSRIEEFQEAWSLWLPGDYRPVRIEADEVVSPGPPPSERSGVFAFSGGVDGTFALLRHHLRQAGRRTAHPVAAVLVHGFDIPLRETAAFATAAAQARAMLTPLGIPLATVRTNWREAACKRWSFEFATGLASCLHAFHGVANVGVVGADEDYGHLELPWGSNPVTNPLLSGAEFEFHTEGGGFTRTQRVDFICKHSDLAGRLRVCWEGPATGKNCGRCEKCVRTQLNFLANGHAPSCFDAPVSLRRILGLKTRNQVQLDYLREILVTARRNSISDRWVRCLAVTIQKNRFLLPVRAVKRQAHEGLRALRQKITSTRAPRGRAIGAKGTVTGI